MSDPPGDDFSEFMADFTDEERKAFEAKVTKFDPKRKRKKAPPPPPPPPGGWPSWHAGLARDDRGRIISDLDNVMIALRGEEKMQGATAFDAMMQHSLVTREWPRVVEANPPARPIPHEIDDDDISRLQQWLQRMGLRRVGREIVGQAVEHLARERPQHPIRDYLDGLVWDRKPRLHTWLFSFLGAEGKDNAEIEYVRAIGKMFLVAMVARVYEPGCQADYMLVLEGEQGILKSTACRKLAGDAWFSDSLPENIASKDARQHLRGKWLMEVSELAAFSKTEVEALKAFITRREEKYRPPFGRHDVAEKRQCLFIGTTNQDVYIKDSTGGRRFWPVRCTTIDVVGLEQARDQLFAEAVVAYRKQEPHWPDAEFERSHFKPQQLLRQEDDPWLSVIESGLDAHPELTRFTVSMVATSILGFDGASRLATTEARRITNALRELGYNQERTKKGRFYTRGLPLDDG
jgi:predicted P-loop ATPase